MTQMETSASLSPDVHSSEVDTLLGHDEALLHRLKSSLIGIREPFQEGKGFFNFVCISPEDEIAIHKNISTLLALSVKEGWDELLLMKLDSHSKRGAHLLAIKEQEKLYSRHFNAYFFLLTHLKTTWKTFRLLFTDKSHNIDGIRAGLSDTLLSVFYDTLLEQTLVGITRLLTDPMVTNRGRQKRFPRRHKKRLMKIQSLKSSLDGDNSLKHHNLTFEQLIRLSVTEPKRSETLKRLGEIKGFHVVKHIKNWRDERLSHNAASHWLGEDPLPPIQFKDVDRVLDALTHLFDNIGLHVLDTSYATNMNDVEHSLSVWNNLMINGARLRFLSEMSSFATNQWNHCSDNGLSGALLIHPAILKVMQDNPFPQILDIYSKRGFASLVAFTPQCASTTHHKSPF